MEFLRGGQLKLKYTRVTDAFVFSEVDHTSREVHLQIEKEESSLDCPGFFKSLSVNTFYGKGLGRTDIEVLSSENWV